jgi:ribose transport system substrate-binding protein
VKSAKRVGKVKIIAFDEEASTLQSIKDGVIDCTIAQNPFEIGYQSVRVLCALARGEDPELPPDKKIDTGVTVVTKQNVSEFWESVRRNVAIGKK